MKTVTPARRANVSRDFQNLKMARSPHAGTPDAVVDKLNAAFVQAVHDPQVVKQMAVQGAEPHTDTPAEFATFIASETARVGKIVRDIGVKVE